jgi:hypothetical protein
MNKSATQASSVKTLDQIHASTALTWLEIANRLDLSETYIHRVRKGKQVFSRKAVERLNKLYSDLCTQQPPPLKDAVPVQACEPADGELIKELRAKIAATERQLAEAQAVVHEQRAIIRDLARSIAGPKPTREEHHEKP